jgi:hypothetical protein
MEHYDVKFDLFLLTKQEWTDFGIKASGLARRTEKGYSIYLPAFIPKIEHNNPNDPRETTIYFHDLVDGIDINALGHEIMHILSWLLEEAGLPSSRFDPHDDWCRTSAHLAETRYVFNRTNFAIERVDEEEKK